MIIDVSRHQGVIDWKKARAAGVELAILKATDGIRYGYTRWFTENAAKAKVAGVSVAAYHYAQPHRDPSEQARFFAYTTASLAPYRGLPTHWLDLEEAGTAEDQTAFARTFLAQIARLTGRTPGFYSYSPHIRAHISAGAADLRRYPLWLAAYRNTAPATPAPWKATALWQYTSSGSVPGINGRVDCNRLLIQPAVAADTRPTEYADVTKTPLTIQTGLAGKGWNILPGISAADVVNVTAPGRDSLVWKAEQVLAGARISISGGPLRSSVDVLVWSAVG